MAVPPQDDALDAGLDFLEHSYLTYMIPFATSFSPEQDIKQKPSSNVSILDNIEQRESLFFGTSSYRSSGAHVLHCSFVDYR